MTEPSLNDLDRCEHGRHSLDQCHKCPGGWSAGNAFLTNGQRIGTTPHGFPIMVIADWREWHRDREADRATQG